LIVIEMSNTKGTTTMTLSYRFRSFSHAASCVWVCAAAVLAVFMQTVQTAQAAQTAQAVQSPLDDYPPTKGYEFAWWSPFFSAPSTLHWRFGVDLGDLGSNMWAALGEARAIKVANYVGSAAQRVSLSIPRPLSPSLFTGERQLIPHMTDSLIAYRVAALPTDAGAARDLFDFARALKVETIISDSVPAQLALVDMLSRSYGVKVALCGSYQKVADALRRAGPQIGACLSTRRLAEESIAAESAIAELRGRIMIVELPADLSSAGASCDMACFLQALYHNDVKPSLFVIRKTAKEQTAQDLQRTVGDLDPLLRPLIAAEALKLSKKNDQGRGGGTTEQDKSAQSMTTGNSLSWDPVTPDRRAAIDAALPSKAIVKPRKPRKLLVIDFNMGYPGHASIPTHNYGLKQLGLRTGAYEAVFDNDLDNLKYPKIKEYDAIFLNNTVGLIFSDPQVREGLLRFVREGGGLGGNHASTHASLDWPEFAEMIGAYPGGHLEPIEKAWLKIDDPRSPLNAAFGGKEFLYQDEFFRFPHQPYSRDKLHVLLSIDVSKTDLAQYGNLLSQSSDITMGEWEAYLGREDADLAISWIRNYGSGRVFYTTMGHVPTLFSTPELAYHMLGGLQFILGDLNADASPSRNHSAAPAR